VGKPTCFNQTGDRLAPGMLSAYLMKYLCVYSLDGERKLLWTNHIPLGFYYPQLIMFLEPWFDKKHKWSVIKLFLQYCGLPFFFFPVLASEHRVLYMPGKCSTTWSTSPALLFLRFGPSNFVQAGLELKILLLPPPM
jgi:hypothetical protein